jgi:3-phenylpropionate/trans-cinnamate dioxygenase ferredoxin subunit
MAWTKVATVQEVPPGGARQAQVGGRTVAVFNVDGTLYAIDDTCPHRGASLCEGWVEGRTVTCPWHAASFDLATGANLSPPARSGVAAYKVQVVGDEVQIDLP